MPEIFENDIKLHIKSCNFSNVYFIYGNEPYLKEFYAGKIIEKSVNKDFAMFNLHIFNGDDVSLNDVAACCESLPMMDEHCCVVVKDYKFDKATEDERKQIEEIISDVPDTTILVFWMQNVEVDAKKNDKWKKILTLMNKYASTVSLDKKTRSALVKLLVSGADKRGCSISSQNAEHLINLVGDDMNNLLNELEKLCFFADKSEITKQHIESLAIRSVSARVFDLATDIVQGRNEKAFEVLKTLLSQKEEPVNINSQLINAYVDIYRAKVFLSSGEKADGAAKFYNYQNKTFRLTNAARDASKIDISAIRVCLDILAAADTKLKSSAVNKSLILEETIVKLILAANGERVTV
ncbi:MAG: DNA polymerase III subunit delta [Ruminococcaceae bacterium]|nr:DNA polymerase III subunit delta [Oscillospiraceae bacterium]